MTRAPLDRVTWMGLVERTTTPLTDCMVWNRGVSRWGYGLVDIEGKHYAAHRVAWELHRGRIPDGLEIDHLCRVKSCINPDHMEVVTGGENKRRATPFRARTPILRGDPFRQPRPPLTECRNGHPYPADRPENSTRDRCFICASARWARKYQKKKAKDRAAAGVFTTDQPGG